MYLVEIVHKTYDGEEPEKTLVGVTEDYKVAKYYKDNMLDDITITKVEYLTKEKLDLRQKLYKEYMHFKIKRKNSYFEIGESFYRESEICYREEKMNMEDLPVEYVNVHDMNKNFSFVFFIIYSSHKLNKKEIEEREKLFVKDVDKILNDFKKREIKNQKRLSKCLTELREEMHTI